MAGKCINIVRMKRRSTFRNLRRLIAWSAVAGAVLIMGILTYLFRDLPPVGSLPDAYMPPSVRITDRNGQLLYDIIPQEGGRNTVLSIENIPQCLKDATIAVEDKNFYTNPGIDITGIARSLWINIRGGETCCGEYPHATGGAQPVVERGGTNRTYPAPQTP